MEFACICIWMFMCKYSFNLITFVDQFFYYYSLLEGKITLIYSQMTELYTKIPLSARLRAYVWKKTSEPLHDKTNKMACAPSEDSDQPGHLPSLIRVFALRTKKAWALSYPLSTQRRLWSDWADAQADLSLRWAHSHFVGFVMRQFVLIRVVCMKNK